MVSSNSIDPQKGWLHLLPEPAMLFTKDGKIADANNTAGAVLEQIASAGHGAKSYDQIKNTLAALSSSISDKSLLLWNATKYRIETVPCGEGLLLRLLPLKTDSHMMRLSSSLDIVPWGLLTIDMSQESPKIAYCNDRAAKFLQMQKNDIISAPVAEIFHILGIAADLATVLAAEAHTYHDHKAEIHGRACWYRFHFIPYQIKEKFCLVVIDDTTENKIMESQYFQAQRLEALGQLAGGVAHDFNNILSIIDGYARMARKNIPRESDAFGFVENISKAVQRGSSLTGQLLTFGRHKISKEKIVDLGALVKDQEALLRPLLDASISLSIEAEENIMVEVPPDDICQILMNLCVNSRDAMQEGGCVAMTVREDGKGKARLEISDTGHGMTDDVKARIFDPFFTTKDQGKGTGLGLSMVYGLVKDMDGQIEVSSAIGQGTSFVITLPLSRKEPAPDKIAQAGQTGGKLKKFTALIAEDEPDLLNLVSGMMEDMGATVLRASNGNEALMLQQDYLGNIDILLTDVVMPELNGVKLAELFEVCRPSSKVMFMSGYPANGQMARVPLPEDAMLMSKPIDFEKLRAIMDAVMHGHNDNLKERWKTLMAHWKSA